VGIKGDIHREYQKSAHFYDDAQNTHQTRYRLRTRTSRVMNPPIHIVLVRIAPITAGAIISRHIILKTLTAHHLARALLGFN
jgi:hypothetical protein